MLFFLFLLGFIVLVQQLHIRSNNRYWSNEYGILSDRIRGLWETIWAEREKVRELNLKLKPRAVCTAAVAALFEAYGGAEKAASVIADNYMKLDEKHAKAWSWLRQAHRRQKNFKRKWRGLREANRQMSAELHLVRGFYEDAAEV